MCILDINNQGEGCTGEGQQLTGFDDWDNLVYIPTTTQSLTALQVQASDVPEEPTIEDVRESRLALLGGIDKRKK